MLNGDGKIRKKDQNPAGKSVMKIRKSDFYMKKKLVDDGGKNL